MNRPPNKMQGLSLTPRYSRYAQAILRDVYVQAVLQHANADPITFRLLIEDILSRETAQEGKPYWRTGKYYLICTPSKNLSVTIRPGRFPWWSWHHQAGGSCFRGFWCLEILRRAPGRTAWPLPPHSFWPSAD